MDLIPVVLAVTAAVGTYLVFTARAGNTQSAGAGTRIRHTVDARIDDWLAQAGVSKADRTRVVSLVAGSWTTGLLLGWMLFGGVVAPVLVSVFAATFPIASYRQRRLRRRSEAADAWPRMIEEIRLLCGSLGRPIPQALLEVGKRGPVDLRDAFRQAEREWLISTDFARATAVLKERLADPTADIVCETLLVAHSVGGSDVERRLSALAEDRQIDLHGRKDARSKQAGVKFARRFVLIVPLGMALAGMSIGNGRAAYATAEGQLGVATALLVLAGCWFWAGHLIRLPEEQRVFRG